MSYNLNVYRDLLDRFIDVVDELPLDKPHKSNRKKFAIPYITLLNLLSEYSPSDNTDETRLKSLVAISLKSKDDKSIIEAKKTLIKYLKDNKQILVECLKLSIEDFNDDFVQILDFFRKSCSHMFKKRKKSSKSSSRKIVQHSFRKKYVKFSKSHMWNVKVNESSSIKCKILLKSSEWKYIKQKIRNPSDMMVLIASVVFGEQLDCGAYFNISLRDVDRLRMFFNIEKLHERKIYIIHEKEIINYLTTSFHLNHVIDQRSYDLKTFVEKFEKKVMALSLNDKTKLFPGVDPSRVTKRHIFRIIDESNKWKHILVSDDNYNVF